VALSEIPSPPRPSDVPNRPANSAPKTSPLRTAFFTYLPFVLSALWTAIIVRLLIKDLRYALPLLVVAALWVIPLYIQHRRQRAVLLRGNVPDVLEAWTPMIEKSPHPETVQPILMATAYAANGWTDAAREAMGRARKGAAWQASIEQRLVLEILCEAFDGDRPRALRAADELTALPVPQAGIFLRRRIAVLRTGIAALARAFNRQPARGDRELLQQAAKSSPLFFWAFSYAAAIDAIDEGNAAEAKRLLQGAPQWSPSSVYAEFHRELNHEIARVEAITSA
jgi:hypothetical protein